VLLTAGTVVLYPYLDSAATGQSPRPAPLAAAAQKIQVVFVLDTTSSMSGQLAAAKEKIWSLATTLAQAAQATEIEMGIVAFRDRGDAYVTQVIDLSSDLDTMYGHLMRFEAGGGGDSPESVNAALADAVHRISWSQDPSNYQVMFLVGDSPPHMDYVGEAQYPEIVRAALARGIVVNAIQAGERPLTQQFWSEIARLGNGRYLQVGQNGDTFAVATPYDNELAELSAELDGTRMFYGDTRQMQQLNSKVAATDRLAAEASTDVRARRAAFNATSAGSRNLFGDQDLVENVTSGEVALDAVPEAQLPETLRGLNRVAQAEVIEGLARQREELQAKIETLTESRATFIAEQVEAEGGAADSLDRQLFDTVREQAAPKGLSFDGGPEF
jgi:Mg-chelatase subunit ChlD